MSRVDDLFDRYKAAFLAGRGSDPQPYLDELSGPDRRELQALVDAFLARGARPAYTPDAFAAAQSAPLAQRVMASLEEAWPELLPRARAEAGILRADLVTRLAEALGAAPRRDKVERYYHQMERGLLDPAGVSDRVLAALAGIVGVSAARLRAAGRAAVRPATGPAFARAAPAPPAAMRAPAPAPQAAAAPSGAPEWDEVDELFRGARPQS